MKAIEAYLDKLGGSTPSATARDLKLNLKKLLEGATLAQSDALAAVLAGAVSAGASGLDAAAHEDLRAIEFTDETLREIRESAGIMGMLNVYYRFRHMLESTDEAYRATGLRMTALAKPSFGKTLFEMLAFTVSVFNGCSTCINAHEKTLLAEDVSPAKIHDLARIAAVVKGLEVLERLNRK